jgi:aryl-alcohol dehydrogenase-like predicted oxidoreductase
MASKGLIETFLRCREEGLIAHLEEASGPIDLMTRFVKTGLFKIAAASQFSLHDSRFSSTIVGIVLPERLAQTVKLAQYPIPAELWTELAAMQYSDIDI